MTTMATAIATPAPEKAPDEGEITRRRITSAEFEEMFRAGVFQECDHIELLDGELYEMAPAGDWHNAGVNALNHTLATSLGSSGIVQSQGSMRVTDTSQPEPDVVVFRFRPDFYRDGGAGPDDTLLLVEVSDTTIRYDRDVKLPLYARAGLPEVWIVTREPAAIEVHRLPRDGVYTEKKLYLRGDTVSPADLPGVTVNVTDVTG